LKPKLHFGEGRSPITFRATSNLVAASVAIFVTTLPLFTLLFLPLDVSFKVQIQTCIQFLFLLGLAILAMGGAAEALRRKL
jgi:hypothetical protein